MEIAHHYQLLSDGSTTSAPESSATPRYRHHDLLIRSDAAVGGPLEGAFALTLLALLIHPLASSLIHSFQLETIL